MSNNHKSSSMPVWIWFLVLIVILGVIALVISPSAAPPTKIGQPASVDAAAGISADPYADTDLFVAAWREAGAKPEVMAKCIASIRVHPEWFSFIFKRDGLFLLEKRDQAAGKYDKLIPYIDIKSELAEMFFARVVEDNQIERAEVMLKLKMNPNSFGHSISQRQTVFFVASSKAMIDLLVKYGGDVNLPDSEGRTPYQFSKKSSSLEVLEALKAHGAH